MTPTPGAASAAARAAAKLIGDRRAQRSRLLALARSFAAGLDEGLGIQAVVVVGSVARGDFNAWSDIDVLVIADDLPQWWWHRALGVSAQAPPGISVFAWTSSEYLARLDRDDPMAVEASRRGEVVTGRLPQR